MDTPNARFKNKISSMNGQNDYGAEQNIRSSVLTSIINDDRFEIERITKYHLYWKFYKGKHYNQANDAFISFNYIRSFIDKVNQFLLGENCMSFQVQGYYSDVVEENIEDSVEKLIMGVWRKNNLKRLSQDIFQMGGVCGDAWAGVFYKENFGIEIKLFDSRNCFPHFKEGDFNNLESFEVRSPLPENDDKYVLKVTQYTNKEVITWKQKSTNSKTSEKEKEQKKVVPHNLGIVPIVHFKNKPSSDGYFSSSDAEDILKLNKVYNEINQMVKGIIDYHAAPTTVVTGATTKNMSRGLGKVWSGLPSEANVYNLGLDADLSTTMDFLDRIKTGMHELGDIPEGVLGKLQPISGTSAAALKMTYQSIYQKASLKALTYGESFRDLNNIILKYFSVLKDSTQINTIEKKLLAAIPKDFDELYECVPIFSYGFPIDRMNLLQEIQIELGLDLASLKEVMNRLGKKNIPELIKEIKNDKLERAKIEAEILELGGNPEGFSITNTTNSDKKQIPQQKTADSGTGS